VCGSEAKVDVVLLAAQPYSIIGRANHLMPCLSKEVSHEVGIRAVVNIQVLLVPKQHFGNEKNLEP
jgi:ribosomal protein S3